MYGPEPPKFWPQKSASPPREAANRSKDPSQEVLDVQEHWLGLLVVTSDVVTGAAVVTGVGGAGVGDGGVGSVPGSHCEYHSFENLQYEPD